MVEQQLRKRRFESCSRLKIWIAQAVRALRSGRSLKEVQRFSNAEDEANVIILLTERCGFQKPRVLKSSLMPTLQRKIYTIVFVIIA